MKTEQYAVPTPKARIAGRVLLVSSVLSLLLILPFSHWYVHMLNDIEDIEQTRWILIASSLLPTVLFASLTLATGRPADIIPNDYIYRPYGHHQRSHLPVRKRVHRRDCDILVLHDLEFLESVA